ncbi:MAG: nucleotidyltransferase domain-containing protein [Nanoarchaeota archaeon]|nr:nucleotidyltransferase domain-containing protein [Nanoarchaeota archaeon]MBU1643988.1 nucleotidyltransferase domain-containing protein [Nanoarchaeota archaeon]MBU1977083.1 nucleotidyltransferase domain-containing protein [Nanoarchaeota archaeon]
MSRKKDKEKILFFRESVFKIAELIFNKPSTEFHIRGLAKLTGISTTAVARAIDELHYLDIVKVEKSPITTKIKVNLESESYRFYKKIFNLYRLERYKLIQTLKETYRAKTIVLFGSFAKGEDVEESDIDLLILTNHKEKIDLAAYEKIFKRHINLHILNSLEKSSSEFKNAVANGIVLHGYLKVVS